MNKEEILKRLDEARTVLELAKRDIESYEAELADAEKPELRHGDYGYDGSGPPGRIALRLNGRIVSAGNSSVFDNTFVERPDLMISPVLGNIFDELAALAKPLKEFEMPKTRCTDGFTVRNGNSAIWMKDNVGAQIHVDKEALPDFILNLRRLAATTEQEGK